jgi:hypothetical protein
MSRPKSKRPRGRPPTEVPMEQVSTWLPLSILDKITEIRAARLDGPDRSSIIRELLAEALQAREQRKRK